MNTIGNTAIINQLQGMVQSRALPQAILFIGPAHVGKTHIAKKIAREMLNIDDTRSLNTHPEFMCVEKADDARTIVVDDIRRMISQNTHKAFNDNARVVMIKDIHACTLQASNALLKSIEEPRASTYYILTAAHTQTIPQTILSRCAIYQLSHATDNEMISLIKNTTEEAHTQKKLTWAAGRPGMLHQLENNDETHAQWYDESRQLFSLLTSSHDKRLIWVEEVIGKGAKAAKKDALCDRLDRCIVMLRALLFSHGLQKKQLTAQLLNSLDNAYEVKEKLQKNVQPKGLFDAFVLSLPRL